MWTRRPPRLPIRQAESCRLTLSLVPADVRDEEMQGPRWLLWRSCRGCSSKESRCEIAKMTAMPGDVMERNATRRSLLPDGRAAGRDLT